MHKEKLKTYPLEELILMAVHHKIEADDILSCNFSTEDFRQLRAFLKRPFVFSTRFKKCWTDNGDYVKMNDLALDLEKACERKEDYLHQKQLEENKKSIELSMNWEDLENEEYDTYAVDENDALICSLRNKLKVDLDYMSRICGKNKDELIQSLKGRIIQDPKLYNGDPYEAFVTTDEYLSGNMYKRLEEAEIANEEYPGVFEDNIDAILGAYPETIDHKKIYITLGSPWIPTDIIDDFIEHILGFRSLFFTGRQKTKKDRLSGTWEVAGSRSTLIEMSKANLEWGTSKCSALSILEDSLNMKRCKVHSYTWDYRKDGTYGSIRVLDEKETLLAQEKQEKMIKAFQDWVWTNKERKERLERIYEENYGSYLPRVYDGSFLTFPGLSDKISLYSYQKDAVARILLSPNAYIAHSVGAGKTYVMISAGMEFRRIEKNCKIMYTVPNNIVGQWTNLFRRMYPGANILTVEPKDFKKEKQQEILAQIRDEVDFDCIIIARSSFDLIPMSQSSKMSALEKERLEILKEKATLHGNTSSLERRLKSVKEKLREMKMMDKDYEITFDQLGINHLFVDEGHAYKNLSLQTKMNDVLGIRIQGAKKTDLMLEKVRYIQKTNKGGGVVFASATPISNSVSEAFVISKFLQPEMKLIDLDAFDSWVGMFAQATTDYEIGVSSENYKQVTRIYKYHNVKELSTLLSSVMDFHTVDPGLGIPRFSGYERIISDPLPEQIQEMKKLTKRSELIKNGKISKKEDNMLKITSDGRKISVDLRLLDEKYAGIVGPKVLDCCDKVYEEYCRGNGMRSTQLVFCDISTPGNDKPFNMYDELKGLLVEKGIPEKEIAYIHDATTEREREKLYDRFCKGVIRVMIGSTPKMGEGVNVQERICAIHHLDIPWLPSMLTQRNGRGLREGNLNETCRIYVYLTRKTIDAFMFQTIERKARFINELISGMSVQRSVDEINETVLTYAELKAILTESPLMKERSELLNQIERLKLIYSYNISQKVEMKRKLEEIPYLIDSANTAASRAKIDSDFIKENISGAEAADDEKRKKLKEKITEGLKTNVLFPKERDIAEYMGFRVILPREMSHSDPYLWIQRTGRYQLRLGDIQKGNHLLRIDHFFATFDKKILISLHEELQKLTNMKEALEKQINSEDDSKKQIEVLTRRLNDINDRLGARDE